MVTTILEPGVTIMNDLIEINTQSDEFFIAIAKQKNDVHSFVMVGVIQDNVPIILIKAGKHNSENGSCFSTESIRLTYNKTINYTAYSINVDQYQQFIDLISGATQRFDLEAKYYAPIVTEENSSKMTVGFDTHRYATAPTSSQQRLLDKAEYLIPTNTCRHAALDTIEYIQKTNQARQYLSPFFFIDLLLENNFFNPFEEPVGRQPTHPFYILPAPPHAHNVDIETKIVLTKLYRRMHHLLKKDPYSECTQNKFKALKALYQQMANQPENDLNTLLATIQHWKQENHDTISPLRQQGLFGQLLNRLSITYQSSTEALADDLEKTVSIKISNSHA